MKALKHKKKKVKKILVIDFGGIGDLILSVPFLRGLKQTFPSYSISILCAKRAGMILNEQPYIAEFFLSPITYFGLFRAGFQLRKKKFDIAINLMPETSYFSAFKMYLLFLLINAGKWVGRNTEGRGFFYHVSVPEQKMQIENEVSFYGKILRAISTKTEKFDETLEFYISRENRRRAAELLSKERRFPQYPFVLINPGADWPAKRWPIERYAALVRGLRSSFPTVEFGIIGSSGESDLAYYLQEAVGDRIFVLSGKTPLEILPAVMEKARMILTNDSGPAHIARAVGTPVVILAGPSTPAFFDIQGRDESLVIYHPVPCAPCLKVSCTSMTCWKAIAVQEVIEVSSELLKKN